MLDRDLAALYGAQTRALNQAMARNRDRFPDDFMFRLTLEEAKAVMALRSQNVTLKRGQHLKYAPYAFTEHGAVMLANILKSRRAVQASIVVVRAFVSLRRTLASHENLFRNSPHNGRAGPKRRASFLWVGWRGPLAPVRLLRKVKAIERRLGKHDVQLREVMQILRRLLEPPPAPPKRAIGFVAPGKKVGVIAN